MFTAKITNIIEGEQFTPNVIEAEFSSGDTIITKTYQYADYLWADKTDVMNMLKAECDTLDEKEAKLAEITAFVGVPDVVSEIQASIPQTEVSQE